MSKLQTYGECIESLFDSVKYTPYSEIIVQTRFSESKKLCRFKLNFYKQPLNVKINAYEVNIIGKLCSPEIEIKSMKAFNLSSIEKVSVPQNSNAKVQIKAFSRLLTLQELQKKYPELADSLLKKETQILNSNNAIEKKVLVVNQDNNWEDEESQSEYDYSSCEEDSISDIPRKDKKVHKDAMDELVGEIYSEYEYVDESFNSIKQDKPSEGQAYISNSQNKNLVEAKACNEDTESQNIHVQDGICLYDPYLGKKIIGEPELDIVFEIDMSKMKFKGEGYVIYEKVIGKEVLQQQVLRPIESMLNFVSRISGMQPKLNELILKYEESKNELRGYRDTIKSYKAALDDLQKKSHFRSIEDALKNYTPAQRSHLMTELIGAITDEYVPGAPVALKKMTFDVNYITKKGYSLLDIACNREDAAFFDVLMANGIKFMTPIGKDKTFFSLLMSNGTKGDYVKQMFNTNQDLSKGILGIIVSKNVSDLRYLINVHPKALYDLYNGYTMLELVLKVGHVESIRVVLNSDYMPENRDLRGLWEFYAQVRPCSFLSKFYPHSLSTRHETKIDLFEEMNKVLKYGIVKQFSKLLKYAPDLMKKGYGEHNIPLSYFLIAKNKQDFLKCLVEMDKSVLTSTYNGETILEYSHRLRKSDIFKFISENMDVKNVAIRALEKGSSDIFKNFALLNPDKTLDFLLKTDSETATKMINFCPHLLQLSDSKNEPLLNISIKSKNYKLSKLIVEKSLETAVAKLSESKLVLKTISSDLNKADMAVLMKNFDEAKIQCAENFENIYVEAFQGSSSIMGEQNDVT